MEQVPLNKFDRDDAADSSNMSSTARNDNRPTDDPIDPAHPAHIGAWRRSPDRILRKIKHTTSTTTTAPTYDNDTHQRTTAIWQMIRQRRHYTSDIAKQLHIECLETVRFIDDELLTYQHNQMRLKTPTLYMKNTLDLFNVQLDDLNEARQRLKAAEDWEGSDGRDAAATLQELQHIVAQKQHMYWYGNKHLLHEEGSGPEEQDQLDQPDKQDKPDKPDKQDKP